MRHGGEIDHERSGPEIVDGGLFSLRACGQHRFFKLGDGKLPISLTEGNQSNAGNDLIGDIVLEECRQCQAVRNTVASRANSENDSQSRRNAAFRE